MSVETLNTRYPTFAKGEFEKLFLRETVLKRYEGEQRLDVWSARLSTGIFGKLDCRSGNSSHAPKGENEIILAVGNEGLGKLIELGFIPCPTCKPENTPDFWNSAGEAIMSAYPTLKDVHDFSDKKIVPFDSLRVDWETLAPLLTALPNRLYVAEGLTDTDLAAIKERFEKLNFKLPPIGYYINGAPWFKQYEIK